MVDWLVWLVVIGGWRRQIILSYKITNNIIGVLRANSLVARWPPWVQPHVAATAMRAAEKQAAKEARERAAMQKCEAEV